MEKQLLSYGQTATSDAVNQMNGDLKHNHVLTSCFYYIILLCCTYFTYD